MYKLNNYRQKEVDSLWETATKTALKPGDFPLGSFQSRAAARAMLPVRSPEAKRVITVAKTLSNEELDNLIAYIETIQNSGKSEPTAEQKIAAEIFIQRLDELKTTGKLKIKPWGNYAYQ